MQYLVNEILGKDISTSGEARVFENIPDVMKHLYKINKNKKILVGEKELSATLLQNLLQERLSTVTIFSEPGGKRWAVSAF